MVKREKVMNTFIDGYNLDETINEIKKIIQTRTITQHVVINANKINLMYKDAELRKIINSCSLINADGQSIVWANKFLNNPTKFNRVTGIDLFENLVEIAAEEGYKVYYLGAKESVVKKVVEFHQAKYPELRIAGYHDGYFNKEHCEELIQEIRESQADILFVAFPSPQKEFWIHRNKFELNIPIQIGVGGSFDVVCGNIRRSPKWLQDIGMEWFYRWIFEPKRLFKRYFIGNTQFIYHLLMEKYGKNR